MTESPTTREAVAVFEDRAAFDRAVESLRAAGFERTDLSVLASHESLDAAWRPPQGYDETLLGLVGEMKYAFPLTTAGLIALVGGPVTATIAALVTAGIGGIAAKDYLDQVTAPPTPRTSPAPWNRAASSCGSASRRTARAMPRRWTS